MRYLASVTFKEDKLYILDAVEIEDNAFYDTTKFVPVSYDVYTYIKNELSKLDSKLSRYSLYFDDAVLQSVSQTPMLMSLSVDSENSELHNDDDMLVSDVSLVKQTDPQYIEVESHKVSDTEEMKVYNVPVPENFSEMNLVETVEYYTALAQDYVASKTKLYPVKLFLMFKYLDVLKSGGYEITSKNRDEKYLEIMNTKDADLINALVKYTEMYDKMDSESAVFSTYEKFVEEIKPIVSKDDIVACYEKYFYVQSA